MVGRRLAGVVALTALMAAAAIAPVAAQATFPGADGLIAFQNETFGGIFTIKPNGHHRHRIANGFEPSWSPNGRWIVYAGGSRRRPFPTQLRLIRADGTRDHPITHGGSPKWEPSFSPDGSHIVYREGPARSILGDIYTVTRRGRGRALVTTAGENPEWSVPLPSAPGGKIAFAARGSGTCDPGLVIYTINPDGTGRTLLPFTNPCQASFDPSWSPSGTQLVFAAYTTGGPPLLTDIYTGDPDGASRTQITDIPDYDFGPVFAPAGDRIVFSHAASDLTRLGLFVVDPAHPFATSQIPHTAAVAADSPQWQPR